jgi:hypothetical protein
VRDDVGVVDVVGEPELDGDGATAILAVLLAGHGERGGVGEPAGDDLVDGGGEHVIAVEVEQLDGAGHADREAGAGDGPAREDAVERWGDGAQAVAALELGGGLALGDERGAVLGALEDLTLNIWSG